ncbi:hypothetical protein EJB05_38287, partial [Eragrostis curvula]
MRVLLVRRHRTVVDRDRGAAARHRADLRGCVASCACAVRGGGKTAPFGLARGRTASSGEQQGRESGAGRGLALADVVAHSRWRAHHHPSPQVGIASRGGTAAPASRLVAVSGRRRRRRGLQQVNQVCSPCMQGSTVEGNEVLTKGNMEKFLFQRTMVFPLLDSKNKARTSFPVEAIRYQETFTFA